MSEKELKDRHNSILRKNVSSALKLASAGLRKGSGIFLFMDEFTYLIRGRYLDFVPRADDIFIVTYPRSGTTWMQMILYQLTTAGKMDFPHICQVSPWFERFLTRNVMTAEDFDNFPSPRIFKTHLSYKWIPRGQCKYIYVVRNGRDVAVSYYHFYVSHLFFKGSFSEFFKDFFMTGNVQFGLWFDHVAGWRENKSHLDVLFLEYEELIRDLGEGLEKIAGFCGIELSPDRVPEILRRCSFDFMKQHEDKFDHAMGKVWEQGYKQNAFLRQGRTGEGKLRLTPEQEHFFKQKAGEYDA